MRTGSMSVLLALTIAALTTRAELPPPPQNLFEWGMDWAGGAPGVFSAADLLDTPAGKNGPVVVRDGQFYTGDQRVRFWGVNLAFGACFPTHANADAVARRLAAFGINAVRLHHMDMQTFPNGIFADTKGEKFSEEALDRLDYLVAALKKEGVYSNINLHVSRNWSRAHGWENAEKLPESYDKMLDIFHPDLIAVNKKYAKDLLTHLNPYTSSRYADEPAVCMVEINNEDTLFLWGGEGALATLPDPYAGMLQALWNQWLVKKYGPREKLQAAWQSGAEPLGENLLRDAAFATVGAAKPEWVVENHAPASMTARPGQTDENKPAVQLSVSKIDGTEWHLQFNQARLKVIGGRHYTVSFFAKAAGPATVSFGVSQAHEPWKNLGVVAPIKLDTDLKRFEFGFTATEDDANARLSFSLGAQTTEVTLAGVSLRPGGQLGLVEGEDAAGGTVARGGPGRSGTLARAADWYDFLQQTDEAYWVEMKRFLKEDVGVKAAVTGTIGLGPLGTLSQSKMDFVDAHAYWDHPRFPHKQWDMKDWLINNKPMVDNPGGAALWGLAATRVEGKPFTVTEYNHAAPNDWQAECVPMIAAYAALQDWDAVFLFAYSHSGEYEKKKTASFFDIEGNPGKMALMPLAARLFLGQAVPPSPGVTRVAADHAQMLKTGSQFYYTIWPWAQKAGGITWQAALGHRVQIDFGFAPTAASPVPSEADSRIKWTAAAPASGMFTLVDAHAGVATGFTNGSTPLDLGPCKLEAIETPFVSVILVPAGSGKTLENADRLLLAAVARVENTGMKWNAERRSVADQWGQSPPVVEPVKAVLRFKGSLPFVVTPLTADGKPGTTLPTTLGRDRSTSVQLGNDKTLWYEIRRP